MGDRLPLSKLSYNAYLIHPMILLVHLYSNVELWHYSWQVVVMVASGTVLLAYMSAAVLHVLVEVPFQRMETLLLPRE